MSNPRERKVAFIQRWHVESPEQTSDLLELAERDPEEAAYALGLRRGNVRRESPQVRDEHGPTKKEITTAQEISRFLAREAQPLARGIRERIFGDPAAMTYEQAAAVLQQDRVSQGGQVMAIVDDRGEEEVFLVSPGSKAGRMRNACVVLAEVYPWASSEAVRFAMTDQPPMIPAAKVQYYRDNGLGGFRSLITVTMLPHTSARTIVPMIKRAQRWLSGGRKGPLSEVRRQGMTDFVLALRRTSPRIGWPSAHREWAIVAPKNWGYSTWRAMERAFKYELIVRARANDGQPLTKTSTRQRKQDRSKRR